jgi:hypothetical protein
MNIWFLEDKELRDQLSAFDKRACYNSVGVME